MRERLAQTPTNTGRLQLLRGLALLSLVCAVSGCGNFVRLKTDVARLESELYLRGQISGAGNDPASAVVVAIIGIPPEGPSRVVDLAVLDAGESDFAFSLPPGTDYRALAFQDENHNDKFDDGEPGWIGPVLRAGDVSSGVQFPVQEVMLSTARADSPELMQELRKLRGGRALAELTSGKEIALSLGQIVKFDSARFSPDAGELGLWQPATFLNQYGITIGLLEPYDPKRIPVLLVHGAGGTAADWKPLVPLLDTTRYQILLYSYPSGIRLEDLARILARSIERLHARYGFERLHVVAHSMGGLVSRSCLLQMLKSGPVPYLDRFVTLSTPWLGHEAAGLGVKHAPVAIPSWIDMATGSEFQRELFEHKLPPSIKYSLGFSFRGSGSMVLPESNDGVVSIASELAVAAQNEAVAIRGFDETHTSILESVDVANWVTEQLR